MNEDLIRNMCICDECWKCKSDCIVFSVHVRAVVLNKRFD